MVYKPDHEQVLYHTLVDLKAKEAPDRVYAVIPVGKTLQDGYRKLTYAQVSRASNKMSWWLKESLGDALEGVFPTMAYVGGNDLRYSFLCLAALKTARQVMFPLDQNSRAAHLNLLSAVNCKILIASKDRTAVWDNLMPEVKDFKFLIMPDLEEFLVEEDVENYPVVKSWNQCKNDPVLIMHTSGTTGLPKPMKYTNHMLSILISDTGFTAHGHDLKLVIPLPAYWLLGITMLLLAPLDAGIIPIMLPPDAPSPMTASYMDAIHTATSAEGGVYIPAVLHALVQNPDYVEHMRDMKLIVWGGAPLNLETGETLRKECKDVILVPAMGSTEVGTYGLQLSPQEDWMYYNFSPGTGFRFLPFHEDLYESVVVREQDPELARKQQIFYMFPDLEEYRTRDVWKRHPKWDQGKKLWLYAGRTDDFVKLRTMTKFNASHVEDLVMKDRRVKAAVMGGDAREVPFLLVEMVDNGVDVDNDLWKAVEQVNGQISGMVTIERDMILVAKKEKPFRRLGNKGTVNRRATVEDYADDIDALYLGRKR